jgi:hypothetical protein
MNNYLDTFNNIQNSIDDLSKNENISLETKQSALVLKHAIELCIQEIKSSANKLNKLTSNCSEHLQHTENIWLIKPSIIDSSRHEIWTEIGHLSGFCIKVNKLINQLKNEAVFKSKKSWAGRFKYLKAKHFIDAQGVQKKGVGWDEKSKFTDELKNDVKKHCDYTRGLLEQQMHLIYAEFENMNLETLHKCLTLQNRLLYEQRQSKLIDKINLITSETINKFNNPAKNLHKHISYISLCSSDLKSLVDKEWGDISWEDFCKFDNIFLIKIENFIAALFDERVKFVSEGIDSLIAFYNHFIEIQERYEKETPEQRKSENFWIKKQFEELEKLQTEISIQYDAN